EGSAWTCPPASRFAGGRARPGTSRSSPFPPVTELSRAEYAARYGPTTGDRVRLGDTQLWLRVERDDVGYGDEPQWGYAKNIRCRMTQDDRATADSELDVLVAGALVVDPLLGVVKTNIGIKDGRVVG